MSSNTQAVLEPDRDQIEIFVDASLSACQYGFHFAARLL